MSDVVTKIISEADAAGRFLDAGQLNAIATYVKGTELRINVVSCITRNTSTIVANTARALFLEHPQLIAPGGNAYTTRRMVSCLRDLEIILRYITYAILAEDVDVLDDRCLNSLRETYNALGVPLDSMALSVGIMKLVVIKIISHEASLERSEVGSNLSVYFDHAINNLCSFFDSAVANRAFEKLEKLESSAVSNTSVNRNHESWEPDTYIRWRHQDKLVQKLEQYGNVEDPNLFEESALDFFESWKQMPPKLKRQIWREREVTAALYEQTMVEWKNIEGFRSVAVAERIVANKAQLAGILIFDSPVSEDYYQLFNLPTHIQVQSSIKPLQREEELIPLLLEWMAAPVPYSGDVISSELAVEALPLTALFMQSGDVIAGCNKAGRLADDQAVTLTTFVIPHDSSTLSDVHLLTVHHGFQGGYTEIHSCEIDSFVKIGEISYVSPLQKERAQKLDVSLIKPLNPFQVNLALKWTPVVPKPPVIVTSRMLVQMYGGVSRHQAGYIEYPAMMDFGPTSSAIPQFTAIVPSHPGDSGSLLVIGSETGEPFAHAECEGCSKEWLEAVRFAMAGILIEGSVAGTYPNMTVFRPISTVFRHLKVRAAYPSVESSLSTESLQSHSEND